MQSEQQAARADYQKRKEEVAQRTAATLQSTDGRELPPTPTQEENDLIALGLMHPDEKAVPPQDKAAPPPPRPAERSVPRPSA